MIEQRSGRESRSRGEPRLLRLGDAGAGPVSRRHGEEPSLRRSASGSRQSEAVSRTLGSWKWPVAS